MNLNKVFLVGRVTKDPELKSLPSGANVVNFGLATNRVYNDKSGNKKEETEFHSIVFFGKTADIIKTYVNKGSEILIEGRIAARNWEKDGVKHYRTEILGERMQLGNNPNKKGGTKKVDHASAAAGDDLPSIDLNSEEITSKDLPF